MLRSKKRVLDVGELDSALEEGLSKKSPRAMTTPGTLRLMKDLEELESNATVILEQNDGPNIVSMEYHVDQGFCGRCPNRFEVTVPKRYPHDRQWFAVLMMDLVAGLSIKRACNASRIKK